MNKLSVCVCVCVSMWVYNQGLEDYFGNVIGYRLLVPLLKM